MQRQVRRTRIVCLACGALRAVESPQRENTGECPSCRYLGWTYADDLDRSTRHLIINGFFAVPPAERPRCERPRRLRRARAG
jgi:hypothetical protein